MHVRVPAIGLMLLTASAAFAQGPDAVFEARCAQCHKQDNAVGAPLPGTLRQMSWQSILAALETGKMKAVGDAMTSEQRELVARYTGTDAAQSLPPSSRCAAAQPRLQNANWNGWADAANTRFQPAGPAGLNRKSTARLQLRWSFGFPGVTTAFGTPAIVDGKVFVGAADGTVYALDAQSGCVYWTYAALSGVRVSPIVAKGTVYFGDLRANVYALSAATGALIWKVRVDDHFGAVITGTPKLDADRLYVPVSGRDESLASMNPAYECCSFRGSVVALDAASGKQIWKAYMVSEPPTRGGLNKAGTKMWGPSGAAVWSSPTLDLKKRVIYAGTGVNYSQPPTQTSDAIVAIDMDSGRLLWSRQFTQADTWNFGCTTPDKANCPRDSVIDADLGSSGVLRSIGGGQRILVASDKGGMVYGIDPDRQGRIVWKRKIAGGGTNGGFMWGGASDESGTVYLGISDFTAAHPETGGGLVALRLATGEKVWLTPAPTPTCLSTPGCSAAQPAPVTVIPGVAFLGSWDGHIRAYETGAGKIIWDFDTSQDFQTVNGVKAHGGSIVSMAPVIAGGALYITAGYSGAAMPGNALLAFSVDGR